MTSAKGWPPTPPIRWQDRQEVILNGVVFGSRLRVVVEIDRGPEGERALYQGDADRISWRAAEAVAEALHRGGYIETFEVDREASDGLSADGPPTKPWRSAR